jgi:hypothetical protein
MSTVKDTEPTRVFNLSDVKEKRQLIQHINLLSGLYEVKIKRRERIRTNDQNAYYWAAYIPDWLAWLRNHEGDPSITSEESHYALMAAVLPARDVIDRETGEVMTNMPHKSSKMTTQEFSIYLDLAAKFLAEFCGIVVLSSNEFE